MLRQAYGSHAAVARELGVGDRYYRGVRNGTFAMTDRMAAQIKTLVRLCELSAGCTSLTQGREK